MAESLRQKNPVTLDTVHTFADGIAVKHPGEITFALAQQYVDDVVTVGEDEIAAAILAMIEQHKLIAEGAGAVSVAARPCSTSSPSRGKRWSAWSPEGIST